MALLRAVLAVWLLAAVAPLWAQRARLPVPPPKVLRNNPKQAKQAKQQLNQLERLRRMSPQQRARVLEGLPPARRQMVERRLEDYEKLSPEERLRLLRMLDELSPNNLAGVRRLFPRFSALPDDRKIVVRQELRRLRQMTPEQREARQASEEFKSRFSGEERALLESMADALQDPQ